MAQSNKHLPKMISNFNEFEGEIIKYSDYVGETLDASLNQLNEVPQKTWTVEDSQQLSSQLVGVKHPWTRDQYEKFAHPDVKKDINYEAYIAMWNTHAPEDQRVILEKSPARGFNVDRRPKNETQKPTPKQKREAGKTNPYGSYPVSYGTGGYGTSGGSGVIDDFEKKYPAPASYPYTYEKSNKEPQRVKDSSETSTWSKIKIETRIMIVTMIIGVILSFITVLILMLK